MPIDPSSLIAFCGSAVVAMILSGKVTVRGLVTAQQIAREGHVAEGRIVRVWRPPVAGAFPRIYFEFQPAGSDTLVKGCHTDRRVLFGGTASLPAVGTQVTVRYLPKAPHRAVIAKLVSRFTH